MHHAAQTGAASPPPPQINQDPSLPLKDLWPRLPAAARLKALQILSRVVAHNLLAPPPAEEVTHERE